MIGDDQIQTKRRKSTGKIPEKTQESENLEKEFNSENGNIKVFHSPLWTMEFDIALGEFAGMMNSAVSIAQLSKSRTSHKIFRGVNDLEAKKRIEKANESYQQMVENGFDKNIIAYKIYEKLKNNKASKAVTAQWFSKLLLDNDVFPSIYEDNSIKYILDAIYHVTKPKNDNNR